MPNEFVARNGVIAQNNSIVTGSLTVTNGVTGSLLGTASYSTTASYAHNTTSASFATQANSAFTASSADNLTVRGTLTAQTIVVQTITSSISVVTGSMTVSGSLTALSGVTGSLLGTASRADNATSASFATQANTSFTASTADTFITRGSVGVGSSSPSKLLDVNGTAIVRSGLVVKYSSNTGEVDTAYSPLLVNGQSAASITYDEETTTATLVLRGYQDNVNLQLGTAGIAYGYAGWIQAGFDNVNSSGSEPILLNPIGGNVGIAVSNPTLATLQVGGNVNATSFTGSLLGTASRADNATSASFASTAAQAQTSSYVLNAVSASFATQANTSFTASTADTFYVRGSVGIGTASPTEKLQLSGSRARFGNIVIGDGIYYNAIAPIGDTNLNINASGSIYFNPNNTTSLFASSTGNVGINTISPNFKLETIGNTRISGNLSIGTTYNGFAANIEGVVYVINGSVWVTDGYGYTHANSTNTGMYPDSSHNLTFKNNNTTTLYINSGGSVGIGTTGPIAKLQIGANTYTAANGIVSDNNRVGVMLNGALTSYVYASNYNDPSYPDYGFVFIHGSGSSAANNTNVWSISPDGPAKGSGLHFIYQSGSSNIHSQTPKVSFVGSSGNVGIGTSIPGATLSVNGKAIIGNPFSGFYVPSSTLHIASSSVAQITFEDFVVTAGMAVSGSTMNFGNQQPDATYRFKYSSTYNGNYATSGTTYVQFNPTTTYISSGNVGIGTTAVTSGYKLDVAGAVRITGELLVSGSTATIYNPSNGPAVLNLYTLYTGGPQLWSGRIISDYYGQQYTSSIYHGMSFVGGRAGLDHFRWFDSSFAELMTLRNSGNLLLGAGINPPENWWRLHITGSVSGSIYVASGNSYFGGNIGINNTGLSNRLTVNTPWRLDGGTNSLGAAVISGPMSTGSHDFTLSDAIFRIQGTNATNNLQFGVGNEVYDFSPWLQGSYDNSAGSDNFGSKPILFNPLGGNIGIGTNNPTKARLQIEGNVSASSFTGSFLGTIATASHAQTVAGGTANYIPIWSTNSTLGSSIMYQNTNAIGINTTTPTGSNMSSLLHVNGAAAVLRVGPYYSTGGDRDFVEIQAGGTDTKVLSPNERFWIQNTGGHILLDASSNIGISTSAPAYKLQTNGGFVDGGSGYIATFHSSIGATGDAFIGIGAYRSDALGAGRNAYINAVAPGGGSGALLLQTTGGNIGINTISPSSKLEIGGIGSSGVADYGALTLSSGSSGLTFGWDYTNDRSYIYSRNSGVASKPININETMYVLGYGNVGIGLTSPSAKLHVSGGASTQFRVEGTEADIHLVSNGGGAGTWRILGSTGASTKRFRIYDNDNARDVFDIYDNGNPIFPYGDVGIGTTAPAQKLELVGGNAQFRSANINVVAKDTGTGYAAYVAQSQNGSGGILDLAVQGATANALMTGAPANAGIIGMRGSHELHFGVGGASKMMINTSGYIGIGTTNPSSSVHIYATSDNAVLRAESSTGQAGVRLMTGDASTNRATRVDFIDKKSSVTVPRWTLISDYSQNGTNDFRFVKEDTSTSVLTLLQGGNVGIGSANPFSKLVVATTAVNSIALNDAASVAGLTIAGTNALVRLQFGVGSSTLGPYGGWIQASYDNTGGAHGLEPLLLNPTGGYVGINVTSPSANLSVANKTILGNQASGFYVTPSTLHIASSSVAQISFEDFVVTAAIAVSGSVMSFGSQQGDATYRFKYSNTYNGNYATTGTTYVQFNPTTNYISSGNVGIGTTAPIVKFQIGGNTFTGGNGIYANDRVGAMVNGSLTSYVYATTYNDPSYPDYGFVFIHGPNTTNYNVWSISPDGPARGSGLHFIYQSGSTNIHSQTPKISFIGSSGNVGIGTVNPTQKLYVNGPARASNIAIGTGTYGNIIQAIDDTNLNISASSGIYFINGGSANMLLNSSGCLGIGTTSVGYRLEVQGGNIAANGGAIYVRSNPSVSWDFYKISCDGAYIYHLLKQASLRIQRNNTTDGGETSEGEVLYASAVDGNVGIGTISPAYVLDVSGTIRATGDVIAYSDARVKTNVTTVENALEKVKALRGVTYTRIDTEDKSSKIGVIAQEVLPILPEVVQQDNGGNYSVAYGNMVGVLIEAIKEQQRQIDDLKYLLQTQNK